MTARGTESVTLVVTTVQRVIMPSQSIASWVATAINKSGDAYYGEWSVDELGPASEEVNAVVEL